MEQRFRVFEDAHTRLEQAFEVVVRGMLHNRHVGGVGAGHHHSQVYPALHGPGHGIHGLGVGQEVRVLDPQPPVRHAEHGVMEDLHRGRGVLGLDPRHMYRHAPGRLEQGEDVAAHEELTRFVYPVFTEGRLHRVHHRSCEAHADVAEVIGVLRVAEPVVDDAVAADVGDAAIEDGDLAMVTPVEHAEVAWAPHVIPGDAAASLLQAPPCIPAHLAAAGGIEQHAHLHTGTAALGERVDHPRSEYTFLPEVGLEMHGVLRSGNVGEQMAKRAPFSMISTLLPGVSTPWVRPVSEGISSPSGSSQSMSRRGSAWRLTDQSTRTSSTTPSATMTASGRGTAIVEDHQPPFTHPTP